jgi:hypothetical protein
MIAAVLLSLTFAGPPDVPDAIIFAVAMRETGTTWKDGMVRGGLPQVGAAGEVSAWQLAPSVLHDLGANGSRTRSDPRYAEQIARRWLAHLFAVTHSWRTALAAYHRGLRATTKASALQYADDCLNLAALYH